MNLRRTKSILDSSAYCRMLLVFSFFLLLPHVAAAAPPSLELEQVLRAWIKESITISKTATGREAILVPKQPVRAYVKTDDAAADDMTRNMIGNFAKAYGLEYEFTPQRTNLILVATDRIADGNGAPDKRLVMSFGFSESEYRHFATANWSTGCGFLISPGENGELRGSFLAVKKDLEKGKRDGCIAMLIAVSFGLGINGKLTFDPFQDYLPLLMLGRAVKECDNAATTGGLPMVTRELLIDCVFNKLVPKFNRS